tara:strand:- start:10 stop:459 length:450 start_codon:yes stop_codon:yes gene_type:complete
MANVGRPKNVNDPKHMLEIWKGYKESLIKEAEAWGKIQYVGRDGDKVTDYPKLPLTFEGFKVYCFNEGIGSVKDYFTNGENDEGEQPYQEYSEVCSHIKGEIRKDQITGGLLGVYNPSITQRLNGLTDKTQTTVNVSPKILNIDPLDDE